MNILILGSGGREHAFALKLRESQICKELFIAPGNAGTATIGTNVSIGVTDFEEIKGFCLTYDINMIVVGPEAPLVAGIYDFFQNDSEIKKIKVVGPSQEGAKLEGSKSWAKAFMAEYNIPTAAYQEFTQKEVEEGLAFIATQHPPIVLKADGLAGGKGVIICSSIEEAQSELKEMLSGKFGDASAKVVIEAFLDGIEFSVFVLTDGDSYKILPVAKDYKRIGEGDTGLNTGGMGAVSPPPFVDDILMQKVEEKIIKPTIRGIQERGFAYNGFIFLGLIKVGDEPFVIEYNCRMGDPETEVVLPRITSDFGETLMELTTGKLSASTIDIDARAATTIMLVSGGYPESYEKGKKMSGLDGIEDSILFHSGTKASDGKILTNGGRVLAITSFGENFKDALAISNKNAALVAFEGKYYRTDIGFDL